MNLQVPYSKLAGGDNATAERFSELEKLHG